mmetsp:Transcript_4529/g.5016  ORF Transcript_4529/g.5016 Transcript_4529/m.5016 type:complete len:309 (-) Transcript_4529:21-947(-)
MILPPAFHTYVALRILKSYTTAFSLKSFHVSPVLRKEFNLKTTNNMSNSCNDNIEKTTEIEVEEKFAFSGSSFDRLVGKLEAIGFKSSGANICFTDWYFDTPSPDWCLTPKDHWLRYRLLFDSEKDEKDKFDGGVWQLKRPVNSIEEQSNKELDQGKSTVYEELEGDKSIVTAMNIVRQGSGTELLGRERLMPYNTLKELPDKYGLALFAKFKTKRSSWIRNVAGETPVNVVLDWTDFGYMVGEVEIVVNDVSRIEYAKGDIATIIAQITDNNDNGSKHHEYIQSKLAVYMMQHQPEQYKMFVKLGII